MQRMKPAQLITVTVLGVLIVVGVAAFGFYRDEVTSYVRLQAWNLEPVKQGTRQFIEAANKNDGAPIAGLIEREGTALDPMEKDGEITGFRIPDYMGPKARTLKAIAPNTKAEFEEPKLIPLEGGEVSAVVRFPRSHSLDFRWDRRKGEWKIVDLRWTDEPR